MLYAARTHWNRKGQYYVWSDWRDAVLHAEMKALGVEQKRSFKMVFPSGQEELVYNLPREVVARLHVAAVEMYESLEDWERHYYGPERAELLKVQREAEMKPRPPGGQGVPGRLGASGGEATPKRAYRGGKVSLQDRLREVRGGVSATEWGKRVGVSGTTVANYEQGRSEPRVQELQAWAEAGGITLERLLRGVGVVEQKSLRDGAMEALLALQAENSEQVRVVRKYIAWLEGIVNRHEP